MEDSAVQIKKAVTICGVCHLIRNYFPLKYMGKKCEHGDQIPYAVTVFLFCMAEL